MPIRPLTIYSGPGGAPVTPGHVGPEAAGQSFKTGAPLISSSGKLSEAAAGGTSEAIVGLSTSGAKGVEDSPVTFAIWQPGTIVEGNLDGTRVGGNAPGTHALAAANRYSLVVLEKDGASGNWYFSTGTQNEKKARIIDFVDPVGTVQGRVRAVILGVANATGIVRGSLFT